MYILGILQFIIIGSICYYEFKLKSPIVFLWATLFIMFGVMHLYTSFNGDILYPDVILSKASLFVIIFSFLYLGTRLVLVKLIGSKKYNVLGYNTLQNDCKSQRFPLRFLVVILVMVIMFKLISFIQSSGGLFSSSWSSGRDYAASLDYFNMNQIYNTIYYALSGLSICAYLQSKYRTSAFIILLLILEVLVTRNRIEVLPVLVSLISIYIFKVKKIKIRTIIFVVIMSIGVIYIVYGLRVFRHYGTISNFFHNFSLNEFIDKVNLYISTDNGELGLRRDFYYFIYGNNNFHNFGKGHSYIRMLFVFIPTRLSFGLKPPDFAHAMGAAIGMVAGGSTHPTLFGDCYANLGFFGILLGMFWAIYASISDYIIIKNKNKNYLVLMYALFSVGYVIIGRGSVYNGFVYVAYGSVLISIYRYLTSHIKIKKKHQL